MEKKCTECGNKTVFLSSEGRWVCTYCGLTSKTKILTHGIDPNLKNKSFIQIGSIKQTVGKTKKG